MSVPAATAAEAVGGQFPGGFSAWCAVNPGAAAGDYVREWGGQLVTSGRLAAAPDVPSPPHDEDEEALWEVRLAEAEPAVPAAPPVAHSPANSPVDWHELFARDRTAEVPWLCEPILEVGRVTALYSKPKAGKSLLTLDMVAALSAGRSVLGQRARSRVHVIYIDLENGEDDVYERLRDMGYGPDDLDKLHYYSFPNLPALDSAQGGAELLRLAQMHDAQVVVIDTTSRVVAGEEDSADTFRALYRHAIMPLKRERRAVLRLDHSGKDLTAGQRGSSAKNDAEDYVWFLTATESGRIDLRRTHSRTRHGADHLTLRRLTEPRLRHLPTHSGIAEDVQRVLDLLDGLDVPRDAGRDRAKRALTDAGHKIGNDLLAVTIRTRKGLSDLSANLSADLDEDPLPDGADDLSEPQHNTAGQTCPGQVADRPDRTPAVPAGDLSGVLPLLEGGQDGQRTCRNEEPPGLT